jgi:putative endonuclease
MPSKRAQGNDAEQFAAEYLKSKGYVIITRNYTIRGGEIDLVALDDECLIFAEVRMRKDGHAMESIGEHKRRSLLRAARAFREEYQEVRDFRFDLLTYDGNSIEHFQDFIHFD